MVSGGGDCALRAFRHLAVASERAGPASRMDRFWSAHRWDRRSFLPLQLRDLRERPGVRQWTIFGSRHSGTQPDTKLSDLSRRELTTRCRAAISEGLATQYRRRSGGVSAV